MGYCTEHVPSPLELEVRFVGHSLLFFLIFVIIALKSSAAGRRGEVRSSAVSNIVERISLVLVNTCLQDRSTHDIN
jgi:hypothetical protein